jgi:hypothetical protein
VTWFQYGKTMLIIIIPVRFSISARGDVGLIFIASPIQTDKVGGGGGCLTGSAPPRTGRSF